MLPFFRNRPLVAGAAWTVVATALLLLRQLGAPALDTLWAEDGLIFLSDALAGGLLDTITKPYAGYMHLLPRLVAWLASLAPLGWASAIVSGLPALLVALSSLFVFHASRAALEDEGKRAILAASIVLLPASHYEVLNNVANLQWFLLFASFWAVAGRARDAADVALRSVLLAVTALSTPLAALLLPLAALRLRRGGRASWVVALSLLAALGAQAQVVLSVERVGRLAPTHALDVPALFGLRVAGGLLVGDPLTPLAWRLFGWPFAYVGLALWIAFAVFGARRLEGERRAWLLSTLAHAALLFAVPILIRGTEHLTPRGDDFAFSGSRYVIAPMLLVITAGLVVLEACAPLSRRLRIAVITWACLIALSGFPAKNGRSSGPRWSASLAAAADQCQGAPSQRSARIPIPPDADVWYVEAACTDVLAASKSAP